MIKQSTIDEVRNRVDIYDVLQPYVKGLKKSGNGYTGLCPFHDEKTGSFHINTAKQIYKCFGCGKGGDAFGFIMDHEKKNFPEAIELLAAKLNIPVEYDQEQQQQSQEKKDEKELQLKTVAWAHRKYEELLTSLPDDAAAIEYMQGRGYSRERMKEWSLGFAPDDWKYLTSPLINQGKHEPGVSCGILYSQNGKTWDFYRKRIIIPIHDVNGLLIGLAGRIVPTAEEDKKQPKYLNPCESLVYTKRKTWYALNLAHRAIKEAGFAYITEGYMDVQSMHDAGVCNTIASCGTEIDEMQVRLLKRYTEHACLMYDGDKPGIDKAMKQVNLFLKHGFKVSIIELPNGQDPDEWIRNASLTQNNLVA